MLPSIPPEVSRPKFFISRVPLLPSFIMPLLPLPRIKYGDGWEIKTDSRAGGFSQRFSGSVSLEKLRRDSRCTDFALIQEMLLSEHL